MRSLARIGLIWSAKPLKRIVTMITIPMTNAMANSKRRNTARAPSTGMQREFTTLIVVNPTERIQNTN